MGVEVEVIHLRAHNGVIHHSTGLAVAQLVRLCCVKQPHMLPLLYHHVHDAGPVAAIWLEFSTGLQSMRSIERTMVGVVQKSSRPTRRKAEGTLLPCRL